MYEKDRNALHVNRAAWPTFPPHVRARLKDARGNVVVARTAKDWVSIIPLTADGKRVVREIGDELIGGGGVDD